MLSYYALDHRANMPRCILRIHIHAFSTIASENLQGGVGRKVE
jgi:hypothetical protein